MLTLNEKSRIDNSVEQSVVKRCQNIYFIGLKKELVWGVLERGDHDKNNETGLKEGRRNRNVNLQCFPYTRCTLSFALLLLTRVVVFTFTYLTNVFVGVGRQQVAGLFARRWSARDH